MKRITALILAGWPLSVSAHPCPFDWNIEFTEAVKISGRNVEDFAKQFNDAAKKQTKGKIPNAIIYAVKPDSFTKVPSESPFSKEMDLLIQRYSAVTAPLIKKGVSEYGGSPLVVDFPENFPVACILEALFSSGNAMHYEEAKEGLKITIHRELECRAYHVSAKFLETVSQWQRENRIAAGVQPESYIFASFSGMTWAFDSFSDSANDYVQESFLDGVAFYISEKKVILAIETKDKHEEMTKVMTERGLLSTPVQGEPGSNKQGVQQAVPTDGLETSGHGSSADPSAPTDAH